MLDKNNEVFFGEYCKTCKYKNISEEDSPCAECIAEPVNLYSNKPVKWEGADGIFSSSPPRPDHAYQRAVKYVPENRKDKEKAIARQNIDAEYSGNKVQTIDNKVTDDQYPSATAVKKALDESLKAVNETLDNAIEETSFALSKKIDAPSDCECGDFLAVEEVDETGNPVKWKTGKVVTKRDIIYKDEFCLSPEDVGYPDKLVEMNGTYFVFAGTGNFSDYFPAITYPVTALIFKESKIIIRSSDGRIYIASLKYNDSTNSMIVDNYEGKTELVKLSTPYTLVEGEEYIIKLSDNNKGEFDVITTAVFSESYNTVGVFCDKAYALNGGNYPILKDMVWGRYDGGKCLGIYKDNVVPFSIFESILKNEFIVKYTRIESESGVTYAADKTFLEIKSAVESGFNVTCRYNHYNNDNRWQDCYGWLYITPENNDDHYCFLVVSENGIYDIRHLDNDYIMVSNYGSLVSANQQPDTQFLVSDNGSFYFTPFHWVPLTSIQFKSFNGDVKDEYGNDQWYEIQVHDNRPVFISGFHYDIDDSTKIAFLSDVNAKLSSADEATGDDAIEALAECSIVVPAYQDGVFYTDENGAIYTL